MTLEDGKTKVAILLDEYDNSVIDPDAEGKMPSLFDMAQKIIADLQPITRTVEIDPEPGIWVHPMPADFERAINVWQNGKTVERRWIGRSIISEDAVTVEYAAAPATINGDTDDTYAFEISEIACQAMPFFVAANCIVTDLVQNPNPLLNQWTLRLEEIRNRSGSTGGGQRRVKVVW